MTERRRPADEKLTEGVIQKDDVEAGEMLGEEPPDGKHWWVIWGAFEIKAEAIDRAMTYYDDEGRRELNLSTDLGGLLVAGKPQCYKCGELATDCHDIPCVGARGRRRVAIPGGDFDQ